MNGARAEWHRRLLLWRHWFLILLGAGFVLFSVVLTILMMVLGARRAVVSLFIPPDPASSRASRLTGAAPVASLNRKPLIRPGSGWSRRGLRLDACRRTANPCEQSLAEHDVVRKPPQV
jgi:hypothetical protein